MSRQPLVPSSHHNIGYDSTGESGQPPGQHDAFNQKCQRIGNNIEKMSKNVIRLREITRRLQILSQSPTSSQEDNNSQEQGLRTLLHQLQQESNTLGKETNALLKEISLISTSLDQTERLQRRLLRDKLTREYETVLSSLQLAEREAAKKEKERITVRFSWLSNRSSSASSSFSRSNSRSNGNRTSNRNLQRISRKQELLESNQHQNFQQVLGQQIAQQMEAKDLTELREREASVNKLESDIVELKGIMEDFAGIVQHQGEKVDTIDRNIADAVERLNEGKEQVVEAHKTQIKVTKKTLALLIFLVVVVVTVILIVVV